MNILRKNRSFSQIILIFTATTLLINTSCIVQSAETKKKGWIRRAFDTSKKTVSEKVFGGVKSLAGKAKQQIHSNLSATYEKIKGFDKSVIIDHLLKNIARLGSQIGEIKDCMLFGHECSNAKRAAFYATSITVLALTAAAVGFTITMAATSKEPDIELEKAVSATSQEVKGWSAAAIFQRLNNKIVSLKDNLLSMKQCLTKRQCTKTQKRMLYAAAATIVSLVTISIGIGIGASIYAARKQQQEQKEVDLPITENEILVKKIEEAKKANDAVAQRAAQESLKKLLEMPAFNDTPASPTEVTGFAARVRSLIKPIQGIPTALREAYQKVRDEIKEGAIQSRKRAGELFEEIIKKRDFKEIIKKATTAHLTRALTAMQHLKTSFGKFSDNLKNLWASKLGNTIQEISDLLSYSTESITKISNAIEAYKGSSSKQARLISKRIRNANEQKTKAITEEDQTAAQQELIAAEQAKKELEMLKLPETYLLAAKVRKPGDFEKAFEKIDKRIQTLEEKLRSIPEKLKIATGKSKHPTKIVKQLEDKKLSYERRIQSTKKERELLQREQTFDEGTNKQFLKNIYPTMIEKINKINLNPIENVISVLLQAFNTSLETVGKMSKLPGIGRVVYPEKISEGLQNITEGVQSLEQYGKQIVQNQPPIQDKILAPKTISLTLIKKSLSPTFILRSIKEASEMLRKKLPGLSGKGEKATSPAIAAANEFKKTYALFRENLAVFTLQNMKSEFITKIKEAPIKNIPLSPKILIDVIGAKLKPLRNSAHTMITNASTNMKHAIQDSPSIFEFFEKLNAFIKQITKKDFINPNIMNALEGILKTSIPKINQGTKELLEGLKGAPAA